MTDQPRIHNTAMTGAELIAQALARITDRPMLVTVTVTHDGGTILAEGYANTAELLEPEPA
jgi:hypothetical protein